MTQVVPAVVDKEHAAAMLEQDASWAVVSNDVLAGGKRRFLLQRVEDVPVEPGGPGEREQGFLAALEQVQAMLEAGFPEQLVLYVVKAWRAGQEVTLNADGQVCLPPPRL